MPPFKNFSLYKFLGRDSGLFIIENPLGWIIKISQDRFLVFYKVFNVLYNWCLEGVDFLSS